MQTWPQVAVPLALHYLQGFVYCSASEAPEKGNVNRVKCFLHLLLVLIPHINMTLTQILPGGRLDKYQQESETQTASIRILNLGDYSFK